MLNNILDQFALPDVAVKALKAQNIREDVLEDGVSRFVSGHDKGLAYRFFVHTVYNPSKSKAAHYEVYDEIEMVEWLGVDRYSKPSERIRLLPPELLSIDEQTGEVSGRFADSYERFKKGLAAPGTSLSKWGVLSDGEIATLAHNGIFSVEQLASQSRDKIKSKFPADYVEYLDRAIQFVNGKENRYAADAQAKEIMELAERNAKLEQRLADLEAAAPKKGKPGRKKKEADVDQIQS